MPERPPPGSAEGGPGVIARYGTLLPVGPATPRLTLHEGDTPLVNAPRLAQWVGVEQLWLKVEGMNPTGSFKDRGMSVAVAKAVERGASAVLCASTGNTAASAAAYAARAGLQAVVLLPGGQVAAGKVAQAVVYGARVLVVRGSFDAALDIARAAVETFALTLVNSVNPDRIEGQTTAAYEICDTLGDAPRLLVLPVGNGGNITAYWRGFRRYLERGFTTRLPRMLGIQAAGAAPLVLGHPVPDPQTIATAIRIGRPATWQPALDAAQDSGGALLAAPDDAILDAYRAVARMEGVFCEPASASSVAGLRRAVRTGMVSADTDAVCVLTGTGLKDPQSALDGVGDFEEIDARVEALAAVLER